MSFPASQPDAERQWLLFVCTGNYYRSRFAEALFNHHAELRGLTWRAFSRGLAIHAVPEGDLSEFTREALITRAIHLRHTGPTRVQLSPADLDRAHTIIALDDMEHRPMVAKFFPGWEKRITFWAVRDMPWCDPIDALPSIEKLVLSLVEGLITHKPHGPISPKAFAEVAAHVTSD